MGRGLGEVIQTLVQVLPAPVLALLGAIVLTLLIPGLRFRVRSGQAKEAVRRMVRATPEARAALRDRALDRAGTNRHLLAIVATEARKRGLPALYAEALTRLEAVPHGRVEIARLRREVARTDVEPLHPIEVAVRVEQLLEAGAVAAAEERLAEGLAQHPRDPGLARLRAVVDARRAEGAPPMDAPERER